MSAGLNLLESCGSCTACIDACPTNAIVADKTVDARRCISYLTVELKGPVPEALRPAMGDWVFGCDICQDVCPWNRKAQPGDEAAFKSGLEGARPSLAALLALDDTAFRQRFRHTALWRAKRRGVLRNAAIALGNVAAESASRKGAGQRGLVKQALPALAGALADAEPLVRGAAAWALGRIGTPNARKAVSQALGAENDASVRGEMTRALGQSGTPASGDGAALPRANGLRGP
ncbi:MAG: HEAT repeat domain-containing protein [SAR324 cluster bacterium]|nr:HEAT repeat domain-containing protein [SAR324 cluster bacterium]